jgi:hypothetical protein
MAEALLPPTPASVLVLLPSNCTILLAANNNIGLCILQGVMLTRAYILPTKKLANLEHLLFDLEPPAHGSFHGRFRCWANSQCSRNMKEQVVSLLSNHGVYNPVMVSNPSMLQSLSRTINIKDEMDTAKASRRASLEAKHLHVVVLGRESVRQGGTLRIHSSVKYIFV